jgi:dolichyl-diphosphooligosaccharide--protein glycosyltransferase
LAGVAAGRLFAWCLRQWWDSQEATPTTAKSDEAKRASSKAKKGKKAPGSSATTTDSFDSLREAIDGALSSSEGIIAKRTASCLIILLGYVLGVNFTNYCWKLSVDLSNPTIIVKARLRDGRVIKLDDYREAYWWLRDNTPEDARIMAWWDYGYQITAISNRTTLADGNTWNHEHIALLGLALTSSEETGYEIARHLADYVLVWGGGGGDDLAKSPHLARIANSVYRDHCPEGDPTCRAFGFLVSLSDNR